MMKMSSSFLLCLSLLAAAGCKVAKAPDQVPVEVLKNKRETAQRRAEALLDGLDRKLADLRARAESSAAHAKGEVRRTIAALEEKKTRVQLKLDELKASSQETSRAVAEGLENAADDLERSYKDAAARFK